MANKMNYEIMELVTNGEALRDIIGGIASDKLTETDQRLYEKIPDFKTRSEFRKDLLRELINIHAPVQLYVEAFFDGHDAVEKLPVHTRKLAEAIIIKEVHGIIELL